MTEIKDLGLSERAQLVLKGLIRRHIEEGTPIGSRTLSKEMELSLSPATIRNVMADLEDYGLIHAPHTSAGRVPTIRGYRVFINGLLKIGPVDNRSLSEMTERFSDISDPNSVNSINSILSGATEMLSQITSFAGIVSMPDLGNVRIKQIEFLRLSDQRVLAILVTNDGQVQNKVLNAHREYSESELIEAANYFNVEYSTRSLKRVREELLRHMRRDHRSMHREMRTAVKMAGQLFDEDVQATENVLVSGENNLLSIPELLELSKLRKLFDMFKTKQVLFDLLQKSMFTEGVNIFIGEESGYEPFRDCSVIVAPYEMDHKKVGMLGVIGPTRMQYDEVISVVDVTAKLLGSALSANNVQ
ncbi:MAG: heat-inducible transcriptional repressor HrcA [Gammaproteobacteria bacterium]|nr:heat-inducible transcriptional repressor HrcA [Gammaproteobacteria bacterium]